MKMKSLAYRAGRRFNGNANYVARLHAYYLVDHTPKFNPGPIMKSKPESEKIYYLRSGRRPKITLPHVSIQDEIE